MKKFFGRRKILPEPKNFSLEIFSLKKILKMNSFTCYQDFLKMKEKKNTPRAKRYFFFALNNFDSQKILPPKAFKGAGRKCVDFKCRTISVFRNSTLVSQIKQE